MSGQTPARVRRFPGLPETRVIAGAGGGKGSSQEQHTPVEAPNTLESNTSIRVIDLLGEGPVQGLLNGMQSIFFDETPLQNPDGTFNFTDIDIVFRDGSPDQEPMLGFEAVETPLPAIGVEVTKTTPVVRAINDPAATSARIIARLDALLSADQSTGDINPTSVTIAIDVQPHGESYVNVVTDTISGKTSSEYQRAYKFALPGAAPWNIRYRRITDDNSSSTLQNKTYWDTLISIEDYQLKYNDSALIGVRTTAQAFGGKVPKRNYKGRWLLIPVPTNYDPLTRTYAADGPGTTGGMWDGTFKVAWSNNPAFVFSVCISNSRWGLGDFVPEALRDKWTLYEIAKYCDEMVPDGYGGMEPRYTFNEVISTAEEALKVLTMIASIFRGMVYWGPAGITATADRPLDPIKPVVVGDVIGGLINWGGFDIKTRHTVVHVTWKDPSDFDRPNVEVVEGSPDLIKRFGYRILEIVAFGCRSQGQAHRTGLWTLETEEEESETCTWKASWHQSQLVPGNIVEVNDPAYSGIEFGGRIIALLTNNTNVTGIVLDRPINLEVGKNYTIKFVLADGQFVSRPVTNAPGQTASIHFDVPLDPAPIIGSTWSMTSSSVAPRLVKIVALSEEQKNIFNIAGVLFDPTKFDRIEQGLTLEKTAYTALPVGPIAPPTNLKVVESLTVLGGGVVRNKASFSWTPSPDARTRNYEIQVKPPAQNWQHSDFTSAISDDLFDLTAGVWGFRVRALDGLGRPSPWLTIEAQELDGLSLPPDSVTNIRTTYIADHLAVQWDEITDFRPVKYEIRQGGSWESALRLYDVLHPPFTVFGDGKYWVAPYIGPDAGPRIYGTPVSIEIDDAILTENIIAQHDEAAEGWPGTFTGSAGRALPYVRTAGQADFLDNADVLGTTDVINAGGQADGLYISSHIIDVGRVVACSVGITWDGTGAPAAQNVLSLTNVLDAVDFLGSLSTQFIEVYPVIRTSEDGHGDIFEPTDIFNTDTNPDIYYAAVSWSDWIKWAPGKYPARLFQPGMMLKTSDAGTIAFALAMNWFVDPPDRIDELTNLVVPVGGLPIVFTPRNSDTAAPFNGGPDSDTAPHVQKTLIGGNPGDQIDIENLTLAGCTAYVRNGGVSVGGMGVNLTIGGF